MKVLSLGLDNSILNKSSALAQRAIEYGNLVEKYTVIVPNQKNEKTELSEKVYPVRNSNGALNPVIEQRSIVSNGVKAYGLSGGNKLSQFIRIYNLAKKLLREEKYDVITVQDQYYLALIGLALSKKFKTGLEIQVHGFEKYYGLRKLIAKYVLPRANAVRCVSQRLKKQLINEFGVKEEKITTVPIFVDTTLSLRGATRRGNLILGNFIFLTVGRLVPIKNIGLQIEAMAEIIKKYPQTELWIVGDGSEREKLKMQIDHFDEAIARQKNFRPSGDHPQGGKLDDNVRLLGQKTKEELDEIYSQADVFVLTSNSEGWGMAVIEAASFDLPIIMTDVGCAGEVIKNEESGLIIPIGDRQSLVRAMEILLRDESLRQRIGDGARQAAAALPSKQEILNLYLASWQKAANL